MKSILIATFLISTCFIQPAFAGDSAKGKAAYDKKCTGCHDTQIHTRPNRIVHTYIDIVNRVKFCDNVAKSGFDEAQLDNVTEYLNDAFYKFIKD